MNFTLKNLERFLNIFLNYIYILKLNIFLNLLDLLDLKEIQEIYISNKKLDFNFLMKFVKIYGFHIFKY